MDSSIKITQQTYQNAETVTWRVQGKGFFRPILNRWPFDEQKLEIMLEDLEFALHTNVSFVACHMGIHSGLSPTIRFPDHESQLSFDARVTEVCLPPFASPDPPSHCIERAESSECKPTFAPFRSNEYGIESSPSCWLRGGKWASSRYIATVTYRAPEAQRFIKAYLPAVIICFINAMAYLLPLTDYTTRISIGVGLFSATALLHAHGLEIQGYLS